MVTVLGAGVVSEPTSVVMNEARLWPTVSRLCCEMLRPCQATRKKIWERQREREK